MENILTIENISKYYGNKSNLTKAISNISMNVDKGEFIAIMGASGSGKTTLLNVISTIDKVTSGHIYIEGQDITKLKGNDLNRFRREELGFIFQDFNLLDTLTAYENIALEIIDNGLGIKTSDLTRVFEKSFTGENGRLVSSSTGMGLYIVKRLCDKLGHKIIIESKYSEYTKVTISFNDEQYYKVVR